MAVLLVKLDLCARVLRVYVLGLASGVPAHRMLHARLDWVLFKAHTVFGDAIRVDMIVVLLLVDIAGVGLL